MEQLIGSSSEDVLDEPVVGGPALTTQLRRTVDRSAQIPGWGSDLTPERRPGVPRDKAPELGVEHLYPPIEQQQPRTKIHKSTEHQRLTPVFGTSCPPRGLSGMLRSVAYKYSEGRFARWLTLMFADRVDMVEGVVSDLVHLRVPNIPREMGLKSELAYNREALVRKALIVAGCVAIYAIYRMWRR